MKRTLVAAAAAVLITGTAIAQTQNPAPRQDTEESARKGIVAPSPSIGGAGTPAGGTANTTTQQADPEQAQRKGGISQPGVAGTPAAGGANTTQPADPEQAQRKGGINQPTGAGGTTPK